MRPVDPMVPKMSKPLKARNPLAGPSAARAGGPDAFATRLEEAEKALERARALHESYFLGMEKRAPETERLDLQRRLNELRKQGTSNTGLRFRLENLVQRHIVLGTYWNRTLREIEGGTYRRDVFKATRHQAERAGRPAGPTVQPKIPAEQPAPAPVPPPAAALASPPVPAARPVAVPPAPLPSQAPPAAPRPRAVPPPIPPAALKRAAAAAIMSRPAPATPAAAPSAAPTPPPSSLKR